MTFQIGDIVRLKTGEALQRVTKIEKGKRISTRYLHTHHMQINRRAGDFLLVESTQPENSRPKEDHMPNQHTLFQTKEEKPRYGHYIATNPEGRVVLAMDTGYEDFDEKEIEEVIPHTVEIVFSNGQTHHYSIPANKLEVNDIVVLGINLGRVKKVDTKNRNPKPEPKDLRKVATLAVN